jgi:hypothetical protein
MGNVLDGQPGADQAAALRLLVQQTSLAGTARRALLLHTDRLPPAMAKPHHIRLARGALMGLAQADRAQFFELSRGRVAIVWRQRAGSRELDSALAALDHLMADLPEAQAMAPARLVSLYDLPDQAAWLLDELADRPEAPGGAGPARVLDATTLTQLERMLAQADIAPFVRWRSVLRLGQDGAHAWCERYVATRALAASLCPDIWLKGSAWLFRRLSRSLDRRMLALLTRPQELYKAPPFGIHLNVGSILAPEFLRFDEALPGELRGQVTLYLEAPDIVADPSAFLFARNFARTRRYRLLLRGATQAMLALVDVAAAEFQYVQMPVCEDIRNNPACLRLLVPANTEIILCENAQGTVMPWAQTHGFSLLRVKGQ